MIFSWMRKKTKPKTHDDIVSEYQEVALSIGSAISMMGYGDPGLRIKNKWYNIRDEEVFHLLDEVEEAYASLGYRIIPLDRWIDYGGWSVDIDDVWLVKRRDGERPRFTRNQPRRELPQRSKLLEMVWATGKACEAYLDENGDMQYRIIEDE